MTTIIRGMSRLGKTTADDRGLAPAGGRGLMVRLGLAILALSSLVCATTTAQFNADFTASPTQGTNPLGVLFQNTSTGTGFTGWFWNFGDGTTTTQFQPAEHTYTNPGTYTVSLKAFVGPQSDTEVKVDLITVQASPLVVDFVADFTQGASPLLATFTDQSVGGTVTGWLWDFGDGSTSTAKSPIHQYAVAASTSFTVTLTAFVGQQSAVGEIEDYIVVQPGQFSPKKVIDSVSNAQSIGAADLDGDGDQDPFVAANLSFVGTVGWYENLDGLGSLAPQQIIWSQANELVWFAKTADFDGDGDQDVVTGRAIGPTGELAWHENTDGLASFGPPLSVSSTMPGLAVAHPADFDGDGDPDLLSAYSGTTLAWSENLDGLGTFAPPQVIITGLDAVRAAYAADIDGDGDIDALSASFNGDDVIWYKNLDGLGTFSNMIFITSSLDGPWVVRAADLDMDGDVDVLSASYNKGPVVAFENTTGLGTFSGPKTLSGPGYSITSLDTADVDGDGIVDVLSNKTSPGSLFWNKNPGSLSTSWTTLHVTSTLSGGVEVFAADLDGDGDDDFLSTSGNEIVWFSNNLASPAWPFLAGGVPGSSGNPVLQGDGALSAGSTVALRLANALPGSSTNLVMGLSALSAPFKGGVLVPSPDLIIAGLPVDGSGEFDLVSVWPAGIPAGIPIWFQHWISDPAGPNGFAASNGIKGTTS